MSARETLRGLTAPLAVVVVIVAVITALLQVPRWAFALAAELSEAAVVAGTAAQAHLIGRAVVITDAPYPYRRTR